MDIEPPFELDPQTSKPSKPRVRSLENTVVLVKLLAILKVPCPPCQAGRPFLTLKERTHGTGVRLYVLPSGSHATGSSDNYWPPTRPNQAEKRYRPIELPKLYKSCRRVPLQKDAHAVSSLGHAQSSVRFPFAIHRCRTRYVVRPIPGS